METSPKFWLVGPLQWKQRICIIYSNDMHTGLHFTTWRDSGFQKTEQHYYDDELDELPFYFEDTNIGSFKRNAPRLVPLFVTDKANMYNRTDEKLSRTNNSIERWHCSFQGHLSVPHTTLWKFLKAPQRQKFQSSHSENHRRLSQLLENWLSS